ncbi:MAG: metal-sensitive transcriptional regulator [Candidatus Omnitrophica bacterium]|nr:metal-sensitive transcriptional regulator [Candidatus Omnitrophota bacterium]
MKKVKTTHGEQVVNLKRIEGQVRGIQRMIEQGDYCVDILTQLHAVVGAMKRVETEVFKKHLEGCVAGALEGASSKERQKKVDEVIDLLVRFKKG